LRYNLGDGLDKQEAEAVREWNWTAGSNVLTVNGLGVRDTDGTNCMEYSHREFLLTKGGTTGDVLLSIYGEGYFAALAVVRQRRRSSPSTRGSPN